MRRWRLEEEEGREMEEDARGAIVVGWEGRRGESGLLLLVLIAVVPSDRLAVRITAEAGLLLWRPWGVGRSAAGQRDGNLTGIADECMGLFFCLPFGSGLSFSLEKS